MARIAIIDDQLTARSSLVLLMRHYGHQVYIANTTQAGKELALERKYDAIICDGSIHRIGDGMELAKQLHALELPVILVSGQNWPEASEVPQLQKPYQFEELQAKIDEITLNKKTR